MSLKTRNSKKQKLLRFMEGSGQRRLLAEGPELSNPPPGFTRCRGLFSPTRGPGESRSPAALAASASGYPRNWIAARRGNGQSRLLAEPPDFCLPRLGVSFHRPG